MVWELFSIFQPDRISLGPRRWWSKSSQVSYFERQEKWTKASWNEILEGLPNGSTFSKYKYLWKISKLQCHGEPVTCLHCRNGLAKPDYRFPPLQIMEPIQQPQSWVLQDQKARKTAFTWLGHFPPALLSLPKGQPSAYSLTFLFAGQLGVVHIHSVSVTPTGLAASWQHTHEGYVYIISQRNLGEWDQEKSFFQA